MGLCQEDATENVCAQVLQLVGIGSPSDAASDYIVKGNNILAIEPNFIKLDDAHLADFLLQLAVLVDGKATTGYLYMVVAVDNSGQFADSLAKCLVAEFVLLGGGCRNRNKGDVLAAIALLLL